MYAVIYKNRVIVGPMSWNRGIFQGSLEKENVQVLLPRNALDSEEFPLIINEDVKIMEVQENYPELNSLVEHYYGPLWDLTGKKAIANYDVVDTPIELAKSNFKQKIADERYKKEIENIKITLQDVEVTIDTTREGRNVFIQKYVAMGENDLVNWKFPEKWLLLNKSEFEQIIFSLSLHIQNLFDWEKTINDQIDATTTKEELLSINIEY
jgi:hypothetical protein